MSSRLSDAMAHERWDRERFDRHDRIPPAEREYIHFERRDRVVPQGRLRQDVLLDEKILERRGPYGDRVQERYFEEDRFIPPARRRTDFLVEPIPPELSGHALAPYRRKTAWDAEIAPPVRPAQLRPRRPGMLRRQSSLDTFDRHPSHFDEYHIAPDAVETVTHRTRTRRGYEDIDPISRRDSERDDANVVRDIHIREERRVGGRSRSRTRSRSVRSRKSRRSSSSSSSSTFEHVDVQESVKEEIKETNLVGRKGRTKMPKRLAHKSAIVELGYPFEEDDDFIIVQRALDKEHIDKIIEISKKHREEKHITYTYEGKVEGVPPVAEPVPPPVAEPAPTVVPDPVPAPSVVAIPPPVVGETEVVKEVVKEEIKEIKSDGDVKVKEEVRTYKTTIVEPPGHHHHHQDLAVVVPDRRRHSDAAIRREILALEAERRAMQLHRGHHHHHHHHDRHHLRDGETWIERTDRGHKDIIRVDRDRKGRLALVRSAN